MQFKKSFSLINSTMTLKGVIYVPIYEILVRTLEVSTDCPKPGQFRFWEVCPNSGLKIMLEKCLVIAIFRFTTDDHEGDAVYLCQATIDPSDIIEQVGTR